MEEWTTDGNSPTSLVIRKMQMKIVLRYHFTHTGMITVKKTGNTKRWWGYELVRTENATITLGNYLVIPHKHKCAPLLWPETPHYLCSPKWNGCVHKNTPKCMFIVALFTRLKLWKQPSSYQPANTLQNNPNVGTTMRIVGPVCLFTQSPRAGQTNPWDKCQNPAPWQWQRGTN